MSTSLELISGGRATEPTAGETPPVAKAVVLSHEWTEGCAKAWLGERVTERNPMALALLGEILRHEGGVAEHGKVLAAIAERNHLTIDAGLESRIRTARKRIEEVIPGLITLAEGGKKARAFKVNTGMLQERLADDDFRKKTIDKALWLAWSRIYNLFARSTHRRVEQLAEEYGLTYDEQRTLRALMEASHPVQEHPYLKSSYMNIHTYYPYIPSLLRKLPLGYIAKSDQGYSAGHPLLEQLDGAPINFWRAEEIGYFDIPASVEECIPALRLRTVATPADGNLPAKGRKDQRSHTHSDPRDMEDLYSRIGRPQALFFQEVGKYPLLTREEEMKLGRKIAEGTEEEKAEAIEQLVQCNFRLVVSIAKEYRGRGLELMDLIQEGLIGCLRAAESFDYTNGAKFSSYGIVLIKGHIQRAIYNKADTIRLTEYQHERLKKILAARKRLERKWGRPPTDEELAQKFGLKSGKVSLLLSMAREPVSLATPVGEEDDKTLEKCIPDERAVAAFEEKENKEWTQKFLERVSGRLLPEDEFRRQRSAEYLSERDFEVICRRFGIPRSSEERAGDGMTWEEIGEAMGLSMKRVRQLEKRALERLKGMPELRGLLDCF